MPLNQDWFWIVEQLTKLHTAQERNAFLDSLGKDKAMYYLQLGLEQGPASSRSLFQEWYSQYMTYLVSSGQIAPNDAYSEAGSSGGQLNENTEKFLDNTIARENTETAQQFEEHMRDTNIISSGQQYSAVGLSPSVINGGISTGGGIQAASNVMGSRSMDRQQLSMQKYQTRMGMAKSILGMVSQMASSGIYGAAIGSARNAAARLSSAAAHSGLQALQNMRPELRNQLMKDMAARETRYDSYQVY